MTAPDDVNKVQSQENQDAVTVVQSGNDIVIKGSLAELNSFTSTNEAQGSGKWIGLDLNTGLDTIIGAKWGSSYILTQEDADEAASVGLDDGHIIFWVKAEDLPRTISINDIQYTVSFENTGE